MSNRFSVFIVFDRLFLPLFRSQDIDNFFTLIIICLFLNGVSFMVFLYCGQVVFEKVFYFSFITKTLVKYSRVMENLVFVFF